MCYIYKATLDEEMGLVLILGIVASIRLKKGSGLFATMRHQSFARKVWSLKP